MISNNPSLYICQHSFMLKLLPYCAERSCLLSDLKCVCPCLLLNAGAPVLPVGVPTANGPEDVVGAAAAAIAAAAAAGGSSMALGGGVVREPSAAGRTR